MHEKVDVELDHLTSNQVELFAKTHLIPFPKLSEMSALTIDTLITTLRAASDAQFLTFMQLLNDRGIPLFHAAEAVVPEVPEPVVPVPVVPVVAVPAASAYRVCAADIDYATCIGRSLKGGEDKRWKPIIYRESQCGKKVVEGSDLCTICTKREDKYDGKAGAWTGRITEEPPGWLHMLGTAWATDKPPVFNATASVSSSASSVADSDSDAESKAAAKAEKAEAAAAAKAAKDAEKAAAKAAAKAAKDAEKAAEKAEKAAAAAAEKEAKAAAKAIKDAAAAVTAAAKKVVPKPKEE
jgi:hypothetical protein